MRLTHLRNDGNSPGLTRHAVTSSLSHRSLKVRERRKGSKKDAGCARLALAVAKLTKENALLLLLTELVGINKSPDVRKGRFNRDPIRNLQSRAKCRGHFDHKAHAIFRAEFVGY
jgi:hypothetical protein